MFNFFLQSHFANAGILHRLERLISLVQRLSSDSSYFVNCSSELTRPEPCDIKWHKWKTMLFLCKWWWWWWCLLLTKLRLSSEACAQRELMAVYYYLVLVKICLMSLCLCAFTTSIKSCLQINEILLHLDQRFWTCSPRTTSGPRRWDRWPGLKM